jgi:hypothetical protein
MRRVLGFLFVAIGLMPIAGLAVAYWVWARHTYTVGLSVDTRAVAVLILIVLAELSLIVGGIYLLRRPK